MLMRIPDAELAQGKTEYCAGASGAFSPYITMMTFDDTQYSRQADACTGEVTFGV